MKEFTRIELASFTGRDGKPSYIAYREKVYDVSDSFLWKNGSHQVLHDAGRDLTEELAKAPHGADLLVRVPVIGRLVD
jgi:predicted heme/steroid binding protein